jgi:hypothetical protein
MWTEATTPINNINWMLGKYGLENAPSGKFAAKMFAFSWIIFRLMINPFLLYRAWTNFDQLLEMPLYCQVYLTGSVVFLMSLNTIYFIVGPFLDILFDRPVKQKTP